MACHVVAVPWVTLLVCYTNANPAALWGQNALGLAPTKLQHMRRKSFLPWTQCSSNTNRFYRTGEDL
eukprot:2237869-Amphidinium_carterae.3